MESTRQDGPTGGWEPARADLSPWAGHEVRLRFRLRGGEPGQAAGWFIDDVRLEPAAPRIRFAGTDITVAA